MYGFLTDAHIELGNYKEAEEACQWMLDLRPGNVPALTRAAYLRELFGDIEGSIELMTAAYQRTPPNESEDRVWLLTQLGHLEWTAGRFENAERLLDEALKVLPDYHYALANLAKLRTAQNRHEEAAALLKRRYDNAPHPENLYDLAEALDRAGRAAEAGTAYAEFETRALKAGRGAGTTRTGSWSFTMRSTRITLAKRFASPEWSPRAVRTYTHWMHRHGLARERRAASGTDQCEPRLAVGTKDPDVLARAKVVSAQ